MTLSNNLLFSFTEFGDNVVKTLTNSLGNLWYVLLINFIGALAIISKIIETQNKKRSAILYIAIFNFLCWILYFFLSGDLTCTSLSIISFIQLILFSQRGKHKWADSIAWLFFFYALQLGASILTWRNAFSLFSIIGGVFSATAYFVMDVKLYRILFLASLLLWICNGIVNFYPMALIHDTFGCVSLIVAMIRSKEKKQDVVDERDNTVIEDI